MDPMSATNCKRCGGEGMGGYKHRANGACFVCGRLPRGEGHAPVARRDAAAAAHDSLRALYRNAAAAARADDLDGWLSHSVGGDDMTTLEMIAGCLSVVSADVAAKARVAFAAIGVAA